MNHFYRLSCVKVLHFINTYSNGDDRELEQKDFTLIQFFPEIWLNKEESTPLEFRGTSTHTYIHIIYRQYMHKHIRTYVYTHIYIYTQ